MSYVSQGQDAGRIQFYLPDIGVYRDSWPGVEKSISRFDNVRWANVSTEGWLTVDTNLADHKSGERLSSLLAELEVRIIHACKAKVTAMA